MAITNKATIIQWNDEKCFGFAVANGVKYIVHLNSLRNLTRSPRIGDTIVVYSFGKSEKGPRIVSGVLESSMPGMSAEDIVRKLGKPYSVKPRKSSFSGFVLAVCVLLALAWGAWTLAGKLGFAPPKIGIHAQSSENVSQYTSRDEVARYICDNGYLPPNYVNKESGVRLYESKTGKSFVRWNFNPLSTLGVMIGGDSYGNREGHLPPGDYREADVDYFGPNRGTKRLVYSSGCNIYYTGDHYKSFVKMKF